MLAYGQGFVKKLAMAQSNVVKKRRQGKDGWLAVCGQRMAIVVIRTECEKCQFWAH